MLFSDDWSDFHGTESPGTGNTGTRYNSTSAIRPPYHLLWYSDMPGDVQESSPVIVNGKAYACSRTYLYAWDAQTGTAVTGFPVFLNLGTGSMVTSVTVANNIVYVAALGGRIQAFDANNGTSITGFPVQCGTYGFTASPIVYNGVLYAHSGDGKLYAFDSSNGTVHPGFPVTVGDSVYWGSGPTAYNGIIYACAYNLSVSQVRAYDAVTGALQSGFPAVITGIHATPLYYGGTIFINGYNLNAVNALTGSAVTGFPIVIAGQYSACAAGDGYIFANGGTPAKLYGFYAATGAPIPGFPVSLGTGDSRSTPAIANGYVYTGDMKNYVYAVNIATASIEWSYHIPQYSTGEGVDLCSFSIADEKLFITSDDGEGIYCFAPDTTPTITQTHTITQTETPSPTVTETATNTPSSTVTDTITMTVTITSTHTVTMTVTKTVTQTSTVFISPTVTVTATATLPPLEMELTGVYPNPSAGECRIVYYINKDYETICRLYTVSGEKVRKLEQQGLAGKNAFFWDGKNNKGKPVTSGVFIFSIEATEGKKKLLQWGKLSVVK